MCLPYTGLPHVSPPAHPRARSCAHRPTRGRRRRVRRDRRRRGARDWSGSVLRERLGACCVTPKHRQQAPAVPAVAMRVALVSSSRASHLAHPPPRALCLPPPPSCFPHLPSTSALLPATCSPAHPPRGLQASPRLRGWVGVGGGGDADGGGGDYDDVRSALFAPQTLPPSSQLSPPCTRAA